ncbi:MAG: DUF348 domain-containing protein [Tissierellia bacterium]|nr:DUF348 domain-containing protein [Tissierellia bacterium]
MEDFSEEKSNHFKILTILAIAASLTLGAYMYKAKEVTILIDDETREVVSYDNTVEELLESEEIVLADGAYINLPLDTKLEDNTHIIIRQPKSYILNIGDEKKEVKSVYVNVKDILKDLDISLGKKDYTIPPLSDDATIGGEIQVFRIKEVIENVEEPIPHEKVVNKSDKLDIGVSKVTQKGQNGTKNIEIKKVFENDKLISEDVLGEKVVKKPIPEIVEEGTRKKVVTPKKTAPSKQATASRGGLRSRKVVTMSATAYDLSYESCGKRPGDRGYGITASGTKARRGVVAVDPRVIPLGTKLYIESLDGTKDYGYAIAGDTGGAIKGNRIDLFFDTAGEVKRFGRRNVKVHILN